MKEHKTKETGISQTTSLLSQTSSSLPITDVVLQQIANEEEKKIAAVKNRKEEEPAMKRLKLDEEQQAMQEEKKTKKKDANVHENPMRARKIRIHPTDLQKIELNKFFGSVRVCYNRLVEKFPVVGKGGVTLATLRGAIKDLENEREWLKDVPYEIKDVAVRDFDKARKAHFAKLKKKKQNDPKARHDARFKFRSKRDKQQSFEVRPRDLVRQSGAFGFLSLGNLKSDEIIPPEAEAAGRFIKDRLGRMYLALPRQVATRNENQAPKSRESVVALDPGVRTFMTTYDAMGLSTEWGKDDMKQIFRLCLIADKIQSSLSQKKDAKRRATKLAWHRVYFRIKNLVREVHRKMSTWLCENYKVILIPKFDTQQMVKKGQRKIDSKTARGMLTWSHYAFRQMLKAKAELFPWVKVIECDEAYTSKTCGNCGSLHHKLGSAKVFRCPSCTYVADRDINAARNILLRYLSLHVREGAT